MFFEKESGKRRAGWRHTRIERGSLRHHHIGHWSGPTNRIAIHVLPHSLWRVGLNHWRVGSCTGESSCRQRKDESNYDNADERQAPPWYPNRNLSCLRLLHDHLRLIIQTTHLK
jgi:hypothetical protein